MSKYVYIAKHAMKKNNKSERFDQQASQPLFNGGGCHHLENEKFKVTAINKIP